MLYNIRYICAQKIFQITIEITTSKLNVQYFKKKKMSI